MKRRLKFLALVIVFEICTVSGIFGFWYSKIRITVDENFYLNGDNKITVEYGKNYIDNGYIMNINDEYDVKVDNNIDVTQIGDYTVTYTVNYKYYTKSLVREIKVIDNEAPKLELDCEDEIFIIKNSKFNCSYKVTDNYDKDIDKKVKVYSNVDTSKVGDYKVTYTVNDSSNNQTTKEIIVHVKEKKDLYYIVVTISTQTLEYYHNGKLYLKTPVTTGKHDKTPVGNFKVLKKVRNATLKGANYSSFVKYWMAFKAGGYGIHDASWRHNFGNMNYYNNGSHGCINVPLSAVKKLYDVVEVGTPVYVKR